MLFALIGVGLSVLTGNGVFDGLATVCIGLLLVTAAILLATETKSLIIGESAVPEQLAAIEKALLSSPGVDRVIHMRTMHLGPDELLLGAKIAIGSRDEGADIAATIRRRRSPRPSSRADRQGHLSRTGHLSTRHLSAEYEVGLARPLSTDSWRAAIPTPDEANRDAASTCSRWVIAAE